VAVSGAVKDELIKFGVMPEVIEVQHTAVSAPACLSQRGARNGDDLRLLFVGRPTREKGLDLLIEAAAILRARDVEFSLTVVGEIGPEHALRRRSRESSLPIDFVGARDNADTRAMMADADVLVVPSRYDACPVVVIEALTCGTPVVACAVGGVPELVRDGQDGLLVSPTAEALATGLTQVAEDPLGLDAMRLAARRAGDRFLWQRRASEVIDTYRHAAFHCASSSSNA
jgi:glycosyltransferase involved in cell wall biosynthesis